MRKVDCSHDVAIVGGGVAGLAAAGVLARAGRSVVILEARTRLGGRIWTRREAPGAWPIELGAGFVHGGSPRFLALLREAGATTAPVADHHWLGDPGELIPADGAWERIDGVMRRIGPEVRGALGAWLRRGAGALDEIELELIRGFVEGFHGASLDAISAPTLYRTAIAGPEAQFRVDGGYDRLVELLCAKLPRERVAIERGAPVTRITWAPGRVGLAAANGVRCTARAVIVTVPLGVLQARAPQPGAIAFEPRLPDKQDLWGRLPYAHALRLVLQLRAEAWDREVLPADLRRDQGRGFGFLHARSGALQVWWSQAPAPLLVGWVGGPAAAKLANASNEEVFERGLEDLAARLGRRKADLATLVEGWHLHNWSKDPYSRGAYSFSVAGREAAPRQLAQPVGGTIFFAGEATADALELGTVHGALASGERAAEEVLRALRAAWGRAVASTRWENERAAWT